MKWIDEMFVTMKADENTALLKRRQHAKSEKPKRPDNQTAGTRSAWKALTAAIAADINDFNLHPQRAGKSPVSMQDKLVSPTHFECDVLVPGMSSEMLVLTLDNSNSIEVSVHPRFPVQQFAITIEYDADGDQSHWTIGNTPENMTRMSVQQVSEHVLRPVLSTLRN